MIKSLLFLLLLSNALFGQHLYIIHGRSGSIGENSLRLNDVDESVVYFTEDEERRAGTMPLTEFLVRWAHEEAFGQKPPIGHFVSFAPAGPAFNEQSFIIQHPRYNKADETLIFMIEGKEIKKQKLGEVTLYLSHE
ncbi:MAG: hypothetical protein H7A36_03065 [Chlamydiales bacterium]|nr:hypothetical protein [Chlamydiales bacterium]